MDSFNLFDVLWPLSIPISQGDRVKIQQYVQEKREADAAKFLNSRIGPLFYRVRKKDLGLAPQDSQPPILIQMKKHERRIYEAISAKIRNLAEQDSLHDLD